MLRQLSPRWLILLTVVVLLLPSCSDSADDGADTTLAATTTTAVATTTSSATTTQPPTTTITVAARTAVDERLVYQSDDEGDWTLDVFYPTGEGPWPLVVVIPPQMGVEYVGEALAERGVVAVVADAWTIKGWTDPAPHLYGEMDRAACVVGWAQAHAADYNANPEATTVDGYSGGAMAAAWVGLGLADDAKCEHILDCAHCGQPDRRHIDTAAEWRDEAYPCRGRPHIARPTTDRGSVYSGVPNSERQMRPTHVWLGETVHVLDDDKRSAMVRWCHPVEGLSRSGVEAVGGVGELFVG